MARQLPYKFKSKKGNAVVFRYPKREDFALVWQYACDLAAEDTFVDLNEKPGRKEEQKWFSDVLIDVQKGTKIHLQVLVNDVYAGSGEVRRGKYRRKHTGEIGLSLGPAYRREGIGTELLRTLMSQARVAGIGILTLSCFETNTAALHIYEKLGFKQVGIIPGAIAYKDGYVGEVKMYMVL